MSARRRVRARVHVSSRNAACLVSIGKQGKVTTTFNVEDDRQAEALEMLHLREAYRMGIVPRVDLFPPTRLSYRRAIRRA